MKCGTSLLLLLFFLWRPALSSASEASLATFWPILDYRASLAADYQSLHLLGPFLKYESKGSETEYALRPLFYRAVDEENVSQTDVLYPLFGHKSERGASSFHLLRLLQYDFGPRESGSRNRSYLFPFLFYGEEEEGRYLAFFPFGGTLYRWFGRDRISFALFPLYSHTERDTTHIDNILWPFFARIKGENESGFKLWPIYGQSRKEGVYQKRFFLWPFFFSESTGLDDEQPVHFSAAWPFYIDRRSAESTYRAVLWPFFSRTENLAKGYTSWNLPWPLVRFTTGEDYRGVKILPFYADETIDVKRQRWYLWPIYKIEEMDSGLLTRRRDRVLFFLYSDLKEDKWEAEKSLRRIDLWPLFGYKRTNGVKHLHIFSLLEPFFPENPAIERLWSPLWRLYQQKWDNQGHKVVSLLWNLYWYEDQGERKAWELFPFVEYSQESPVASDLRFLKGLVRFRTGGDGKQLNLFYLPWGLHWGRPLAENR